MDKWKIKLFSTYASTEMSTAFTECEHGVGGHHHPELIIVEVLDENNNPVKNGESGELTFTTLGIEAMPLVRFKTGDIVQLHTESLPVWTKYIAGRTCYRKKTAHDKIQRNHFVSTRNA